MSCKCQIKRQETDPHWKHSMTCTVTNESERALSYKNNILFIAANGIDLTFISNCVWVYPSYVRNTKVWTHFQRLQDIGRRINYRNCKKNAFQKQMILRIQGVSVFISQKLPNAMRYVFFLVLAESQANIKRGGRRRHNAMIIRFWSWKLHSQATLSIRQFLKTMETWCVANVLSRPWRPTF